MQRHEHQYSASLQTRHTRTITTPFATVTENYHSLPEERDEENSNSQGATMDREERDKQNDL